MKSIIVTTPQRDVAALLTSATCLLSLVSSCAAAPAPAPPAVNTPAATKTATPPKMGVWLYSNEENIVRYEKWTNQSMAPLISFLPDDNWECLSGVTKGYGTAWALDQWEPAYRNRVQWSAPMLPKIGHITKDFGKTIVKGGMAPPTLAEGATGAYDHHWKNLADSLIAKGYGDANVRIGWEFTGNWFRWHANNSTEAVDYKNYWKKIVLAMRSRPGANFKFNWCGASNTGFDPAQAYPEDDANGSYVDEIGIDVYDTNWKYYPVKADAQDWEIDSARSNAWLALSEWGNYPLNWWAKFAASKGKPLTIPEWGLAYSEKEHGGRDNPIFIQKFHEWVMNPVNGVSWHAYFQEDVSFKSKIFEEKEPATFPKATAVFQKLFWGRPTNVVFQNPINNIVQVDGAEAKVMKADTKANPTFEGDAQYKITYNGSAPIQFKLKEMDVSGATHLRLATKGPVTNEAQSLQVRLMASDGTIGPLVSVPRATTYTALDIPLSSLSKGVTLSKISGLSFVPTPSTPAGASDSFYLDNVLFIRTTP